MIVEKLATCWSVNDPMPESAELIVPVAHGATTNNLTNGAYAVRNKTRQLMRRYPTALVAFGAFTGSANPKIEEGLKRRELPGSLFVGLVISTIEECLKIRLALPESFEPQTIIVVTDEAHSRRCRIVWRVFFPQSDIRIVSVPIRATTDYASPMWSYHHPWATLLWHALPTPYFWYLAWRGEEYMASKAITLHQPITT